MRPLAAFLVFIALYAGPALGAGFDCATPEQREQSLSKLISMVDALRNDVERVPPSDAQFIRQEQRDAAWAGLRGNYTRMRTIMSNPYYYPLQLHDAVDKVLEPLKRAEGNGTKRQALGVISAMGSFGSVTSSLDDYLLFDTRRAHRVIDANDKENRPTTAKLVGVVVSGFASCLVQQLPDD